MEAFSIENPMQDGEIVNGQSSAKLSDAKRRRATIIVDTSQDDQFTSTVDRALSKIPLLGVFFKMQALVKSAMRSLWHSNLECSLG